MSNKSIEISYGGVTKEYEMESLPSVPSGGGGGGKWHKVAEVITTEEVSRIDVTERFDGTPLQVGQKEFFAEFIAAPSSTNNDKKSTRYHLLDGQGLAMQGVELSYCTQSVYTTTHYTRRWLHFGDVVGFISCNDSFDYANGASENEAWTQISGIRMRKFVNTLTQKSTYDIGYSTDGVFGVGSRITVYERM